MSRPRRGTEAVFYDTFADWDAADQAAALKVLEALHRQTERQERKPVNQRIAEVLPQEIKLAVCPTCAREMMSPGDCQDTFHIPF